MIMNNIEQTLSIIKPDAVERNLDNEIKVPVEKIVEKIIEKEGPERVHVIPSKPEIIFPTPCAFNS